MDEPVPPPEAGGALVPMEADPTPLDSFAIALEEDMACPDIEVVDVMTLPLDLSDVPTAYVDGATGEEAASGEPGAEAPPEAMFVMTALPPAVYKPIFASVDDALRGVTAMMARAAAIGRAACRLTGRARTLELQRAAQTLGEASTEASHWLSTTKAGLDDATRAANAALDGLGIPAINGPARRGILHDLTVYYGIGGPPTRELAAVLGSAGLNVAGRAQALSRFAAAERGIKQLELQIRELDTLRRVLNALSRGPALPGVAP